MAWPGVVRWGAAAGMDVEKKGVKECTCSPFCMLLVVPKLQTAPTPCGAVLLTSGQQSGLELAQEAVRMGTNLGTTVQWHFWLPALLLLPMAEVSSLCLWDMP